MNVIPLILSGGAGTRLWPLSRAARPKQFLSFGSPCSLFQETVLRCRNPIFDRRAIVVGAEAHRFLLAQHLSEIGAEADILLEPVARNSCAAIAAGCFQALAREPGAIVLALAADHAIPDALAFTEAVASAVPAARNGQIVTFGVTPDHPATGYGYISPAQGRTGSVREVRAFVEKPDLANAERFLAEGYLWNSGNFLFRAADVLDEIERLQPEIHRSVRLAFERAAPDLDFLRLDPAAFAAAPAISIDHAVMEKTGRAAVLPVSYAWSDVGNWDAVSRLGDGTPDGNARFGDAVVLDGTRNVVHSQGRLTALLGVSDVVVVATRDSILVTHRERAEDVKSLVSTLAAEGRWQARETLQVHRPWGNYEQLDAGEGYQVKRLTINPGGILSLQRHCHRAEHWVVVQGEAEVTVGDKVSRLGPNESLYIPKLANHRLANRGNSLLVLIEVQSGSYLGEDDIIRLEDVYNRPATETATHS